MKILRAFYTAFVAFGLLVNTPAKATSYQDMWWNPAESGWGLNLTQQGDTIFAIWFVYDATKRGTWFVSTCNLVDDRSCEGELYVTNGPAYVYTGVFDPKGVTETQVGSASFTFTDANHGTLKYSASGASVTKNISRFTYNAAPIAGAYWISGAGTATGCDASGTYDYRYDNSGMVLAINGSNLDFTFKMYNESDWNAAFSCAASGPFAQYGRQIAFSAPYSCSDGSKGALAIRDLTIDERGLMGAMTWDHSPCVEAERFAGARHPSSAGGAVSQPIDPAGGKVGNDQLTLTFPAGTFTASTNVTITPTTADTSLVPGINVITKANVIAIAGRRQQPIVVSVTATSLPSAGQKAYIALVSDRWVDMNHATPRKGIRFLEAKVVGNRLEATLPATAKTAAAKGFIQKVNDSDLESIAIYGADGMADRSSTHFTVYYPNVNQASCDVTVIDEWLQYAEDAYTRLVTTKGYVVTQLGMPLFRMPMTVVKLGDKEYAKLSYTWASMLLDTYSLNIELPLAECRSKTEETRTEMKASLGHEFFHAIQNAYDNVPALLETTLNNNFGLCLYDASSTQFESEMVGNNDYLGLPTREQVFEGNGFYRQGLGLGCKLERQTYGYGMGTFMHYLVDRFGPNIVTSIWLRVHDQTSTEVPVDTIQSAGVDLAVHWHAFAEKLFTGTTGHNWQLPKMAKTYAYQSGSVISIADNLPQLASDGYRIDFSSLAGATGTAPTCRLKQKTTETYKASLFHGQTKVAELGQDFTPLADNGYTLVVSNVDLTHATSNGAVYGRIVPVEIVIDCGGTVDPVVELQLNYDFSCPDWTSHVLGYGQNYFVMNPMRWNSATSYYGWSQKGDMKWFVDVEFSVDFKSITYFRWTESRQYAGDSFHSVTVDLKLKDFPLTATTGTSPKVMSYAINGAAVGNFLAEGIVAANAYLGSTQHYACNQQLLQVNWPAFSVGVRLTR